jgi:hypothetical protein
LACGARAWIPWITCATFGPVASIAVSSVFVLPDW